MIFVYFQSRTTDGCAAEGEFSAKEVQRARAFRGGGSAAP